MVEERLRVKAPGWERTWYAPSSGVGTQRKTKVIGILIQVINASRVMAPYVLHFPGQSQILCSVTAMGALVLVVV